MDAMDTQILRILQSNARSPATTIAKQVGLSVPAVLERIRKLNRNGVITRFTVQLNRTLVNEKLLVFLLIRLTDSSHIEAFRTAAIAFPCVLECHHMAGEYDYLLKVALSDTAALETFLSNQLKQIPGVKDTNTLIALTTLKEGFNAPL